MRFARLQIVTTGLVLLAVLVVPARLGGDAESILLLVACAYFAVQFCSAVAVLYLDSPTRHSRTTSRSRSG